MTLLAIVLLSMLCGAKGWDAMYEWALIRQAWLATFLDLSAGVPSADTLRRVMAALEPKTFRERFSTWAQAMASVLPDLQIAVDGKTIRGSGRAGLQAVHVVRAFAVNGTVQEGRLRS